MMSMIFYVLSSVKTPIVGRFKFSTRRRPSELPKVYLILIKSLTSLYLCLGSPGCNESKTHEWYIHLNSTAMQSLIFSFILIRAVSCKALLQRSRVLVQGSEI
jgi:hypothetical protein